MAYATLWQRLVASLFDTLIIGLVYLLIFTNVSILDHHLLLSLFTILSYGYKPFCEYKYQGTPGKKAMNIFVVNEDYQPPSLKEVLTRNIFHLGLAFVYLFTSLAAVAIQHQGSSDSILLILDNIQDQSLLMATLLHIGDVISLLKDSKNRTLHDRIAHTYVVSYLQTDAIEKDEELDLNRITKLKKIYSYKSVEDLKSILDDERFVEEAKIAAKEMLDEKGDMINQ